MTVHSWESASGKNVILEYIEGLSNEEQIDAYDVLEHLENGEFDQIYYKRWDGKIFEVYFKKHNRIFFVVVEKKDIYLLHACKKQKNKTEKSDKKTVVNRAKELGRILHKKFI